MFEANEGLIAIACACAAVTGFCLWQVYDEHRCKRTRMMAMLAAGGSRGPREGREGARARTRGLSGLQQRAIDQARRLSHGIELGGVRCLLPGRRSMPERLRKQLLLAGLQDEVTLAGYRESRLRQALLGCLLGGVAGALFSTELMALGAVAGAAAGWRLLPGACAAKAASRKRDLERQLPEMLDVLALGMRSGLSFDGSLTLYDSHFDTALSRAFSAAQQQWRSGLLRRDEALRAIAATYDSFLFKRVVDNILRSLRFGASLTEGLEEVAREARADHKAHRQEAVAKVPIKMMLPTGALMLPAMLILVLGPVLLELAGNM